MGAARGGTDERIDLAAGQPWHRLDTEARRPDLRWPLPPDLVQVLTGARVTALRRRSKYILADLEAGFRAAKG